LEELRRLTSQSFQPHLIAPAFNYEPQAITLDHTLDGSFIRDLVPFGDSFASAEKFRSGLCSFSKSETVLFPDLAASPNVFSAAAA
jgi:hypothetical protein